MAARSIGAASHKPSVGKGKGGRGTVKKTPMWLALRKQKERKLKPWGLRVAGAFLPTSVFFAVAIIAGGPPAAPPRLPLPNFGALVPLAKPEAPAPSPAPSAAAPAPERQAPAPAPSSSSAALQPAGSAMVPLAPNADGMDDFVQLADFAPQQLGAGSKAVASAGATGLAWLLKKTPLGGADFSTLAAAAALYQKGDVAGGDALAARIDDPLQRLALEWVALRAAPREAGLARLTSFMGAHPHWPSRGWLVSFREALLYADRNRPYVIRKAFAGATPATPAGILALATVERDEGHADKAAAMVRDLWRDGNLDGWHEGAILRDFGALLTKADHRARAIRLLYAEKYGAAARAAALAGGDTPLLANSWVAASRGALSDKALAALPAAVKNAPGLLYARIEGLRRADRALEAAQLMRAAPKDPAALVAGDRWWD